MEWRSNTKLRNTNRFILDKKRMDVEYSNHMMTHETEEERQRNFEETVPFFKQDPSFNMNPIYKQRLCSHFQMEGRKRILPFAECTNSSPAEPLWPVRKRIRPIANPQIAVLDLPLLRTNKNYNVINWGPTNYIAAALRNALYEWHVPTSTVSEKIAFASDITALRYNHTGTQLLMNVVNAPMNLVMWDTELSKQVGGVNLKENNYYSSCVNSIDWHPSNKYFAAGCQSTCQIFIGTSELEIISKFKAHDRCILKILFSPDGKNLASTSEDRFVKVWAFPSSILLYSYQEKATVRGISWHPWRISYLCTGSVDGHLALHHTSVNKVLKKIELQDVDILDLSFNKLSGELAVNLTRRIGGAYQFDTFVLASFNQAVQKFVGHVHQIMYLEWSPDSKILATAGRDETLQLWSFISKHHEQQLREKTKTSRKIKSSELSLYSFIR